MASRQFNIFVEGTDDHDLIVVLVKQLRDTVPHPTMAGKREGQMVTTYLVVVATGDVIFVSSTGGWKNLGSKQSFSIRQAREAGGKTLIVFDADDDPATRAVTLRQQVLADEPNPQLYLLPGPGQPGELETLLLRLTQPQHQRVLACYDSYEACLQQFANSDGSFYYNAPSRKRRIYDYVNVMPLEGEEKKRHQQGGQKIFENTDIWNLDAAAIQPLRDFLNQQLP